MARRSGLGKGLGALIPTESTGEAGAALREVPIASIRPNPHQPRTHFDEAAMASLAASIQALGVLQPILVRELEDAEAFELIAGERRWRAARRAGLQRMPVLVRSGTDDADSLEQALVENLHREDLNPLEEAAAYQQLIDEFGLTHDAVAARVGRSRAAVTNTLRLLQLPAGVQRSLADGTITAGHARALLGTPDRNLQEALVPRIVAEGLTVRAVEELVRGDAAESNEEPGADVSGATGPAAGSAAGGSYRAEEGPLGVPGEEGNDRPARSPLRALPEPGVLELEELLSTYLDTRVRVELHQRRGRLVVEFATLEDLERIYRVMVTDEQPTSTAAP